MDGLGDVCMILNDEQIKETMESPLNLLNRLKHATHLSSNQNIIPSLPPTSEQLISDLEDKLKQTSIKSKAAAIMTAAMNELEKRMPEIQKPERLASIAAEMAKVVSATQAKNDDGYKQAQVIIYAPQFRTEEAYDVITVNE